MVFVENSELGLTTETGFLWVSSRGIIVCETGVEIILAYWIGWGRWGAKENLKLFTGSGWILLLGWICWASLIRGDCPK